MKETDLWIVGFAQEKVTVALAVEVLSQAFIAYAASLSTASWRICPSSVTSSNWTDTRLEIPDSCIVTPYKVVAAVMVFFECVTMMNFVNERNSFNTETKRPTLASSNGASTSSNTQKGLGRN